MCLYMHSHSHSDAITVAVAVTANPFDSSRSEIRVWVRWTAQAHLFPTRSSEDAVVGGMDLDLSLKETKEKQVK